MALQRLNKQVIQPKSGTLCDLFIRKDMKWAKGVIIGTNSDKNGEWIKVRCGHETHSVLSHDPDLRVKARDVVSKQSLTWFNVTRCVMNELFPTLSFTMDLCVEEKLSDEPTFKLDDFGEDAVNDIIERLNKKRTMNNTEVSYLKKLIQRAVEHQNGTKQNVADTPRQISSNEHYYDRPQVSLEMLADIYGVHKALKFGQFQRADYPLKEFKSDVNIAEVNTFGGNALTHLISQNEQMFRLSFYPIYLVNDDVFKVMACHFAVSLVVNEMVRDWDDINGLHVRSVVVPNSICSRYDVDDEWKLTFPTIWGYLQSIAVNKAHITRGITADIGDVLRMAKTISDSIALIRSKSVNNMAIVFDRHKNTENDPETVTVFEVDDWTDLDELQKNHFISFDFNVSCDGDKNVADAVVRCWLTFGVNQRLRWYPEYAVWIIPHLFVRSTTMSTYKVVDTLYEEHHKHGWRVALDDKEFNKYYHIITGFEHISNNYNRDEVKRTMAIQRSLRDELDGKMEHKMNEILNQYILEHAHDSDSILYDVMTSTSRIEKHDSNIVPLMDPNSAGFRVFKFMILRFQDLQCKKEAVCSIEDCECIEKIIQNLQKFEKCNFEIDALSVIDFDLDSIINVFDHLVRVHDFLSDDIKKLEIQQHVESRVICEHGAKCKVLERHSTRARERNTTEEKSSEPEHEVDSLCEVTADALHSVHCYVLHRDNHLYRVLRDDNNKLQNRFVTPHDDTEKKENDDYKLEEQDETLPLGLNFGCNVLEWLAYGVKPHFDTLKDEWLRNPQSTIDAVIFTSYLMICIAKSKESNFSVDELMCLKLYSDTTELQALLRKAHWTVTPLEVRKMYYQWAMGLYKAHLYHAKPVPADSNNKPCQLFHGLSKLFMADHELPIYNGPFSTTIAKSVATVFSEEKGLIFMIQPSYANPLKFCIGILMDWISGFKHEREVLLYNQFLPIQKTEMFDEDPKILVDHFMYSLFSREAKIIKKEAFYKKLGVQFQNSWIPLILQHDLLFKPCKTKDGKLGMRIIGRLCLELGIAFFQTMTALRSSSFIDDQNTLRLRNISNLDVSHLVFWVGLRGENYDAESTTDVVHHFKDVKDFAIPCEAARQSDAQSLEMVLHSKTNDDSFEFAEIHSVMLSRYEFTRNTPLKITDAVKIPPYNPNRGQTGNLCVSCTSDIVIAQTASVTSVQAASANLERSIRLISQNTVTVNGILESKTLKSKDIVIASQGQSEEIFIVADRFVNGQDGMVKTDFNGNIHVFCREYIDNGEVSPVPNVHESNRNEVRLTNGDPASFVDYFMFMLHRRSELISNAEAFYKDIGVKMEKQWYQQLVNHEMLFAKSEFRDDSIDEISDVESVESFDESEDRFDIQSLQQTVVSMEQTVVSMGQASVAMPEKFKQFQEELAKMQMELDKLNYKADPNATQARLKLPGWAMPNKLQQIQENFAKMQEDINSEMVKINDINPRNNANGARGPNEFGLKEKDIRPTTRRSTCIERLKREFDVDIFRFYDAIYDAIAFDDDHNVVLMGLTDEQQAVLDVSLKHYVFKACFGNDDEAKVQESSFQNVSQFVISQANTFNNDDIEQLCIFVKGADSDNYIRIKSLLKRQYIFTDPLHVEKSIEIPPTNRRRGRSGCLQIECPSSIVIAEDVIIRGSNQMARAKGATISLVSGGTITNHGVLRCNGLGDGEGGDIYIVADSFVNNGKVVCVPDGRIHIFCREYTNNGTVRPKPRVITPKSMLKRHAFLSAFTSDDDEKRAEAIEVSLNIVLVGNRNIGKTAMINRYTRDTFQEDLEVTDGADYSQTTCQLEFGGKSVKLVQNIWDTVAGDAFQSSLNDAERSRDSIISLLEPETYEFERDDIEDVCRGADVIIFCYDTTDRESLIDVGDRWFPKIKTAASEASICMLIGTKCDLREKSRCSKEEVLEVAKICRANVVLECSSSTGQSVSAVFKYSMGIVAQSNILSASQASEMKINLDIERLKNFGNMMFSNILVVGSSQVGKSALVRQHVDNMFIKRWKPTIGAELHFTQMYDEDLQCSVNNRIWDTAGIDDLHTLDDGFYAAADFIIFCYDTTNKESLSEVLLKWVPKMRQSVDVFPPSVMVGTKTDLFDSEFSEITEIEDVAKACGAWRVFKCSSVNGDAINDIFRYITKILHSQSVASVAVKNLHHQRRNAFIEIMNILKASIVISNDEAEDTLRITRDENVIYSVFSDFVFAVGLGDQVQSKEAFGFKDCDDFTIPCNTAFGSQVSSLEFNIFIKATDESFDFVPVHSLFLPRYEFSTPLVFTKSVEIPPFDEERGQFGTLRIQCSSDVVISPNVRILGDGVRADSKGGVIRLFGRTISNQGALYCNGLEDGEGGTIYVVAGSFVNDGEIKCVPNGQIHIFCREYINNGTINPEPRVNKIDMGTYDDVTSLSAATVDYVVFAIRTKRYLIEDIKTFYQEIGVRAEPNWVQQIVDHKNLFDETEYDGKRVIDRLAEEVPIGFEQNGTASSNENNFWTLYRCICGILMLNEDMNITLGDDMTDDDYYHKEASVHESNRRNSENEVKESSGHEDLDNNYGPITANQLEEMQKNFAKMQKDLFTEMKQLDPQSYVQDFRRQNSRKGNQDVPIQMFPFKKIEDLNDEEPTISDVPIQMLDPEDEHESKMMEQRESAEYLKSTEPKPPRVVLTWKIRQRPPIQELLMRGIIPSEYTDSAHGAKEVTEAFQEWSQSKKQRKVLLESRIAHRLDVETLQQRRIVPDEYVALINGNKEVTESAKDRGESKLKLRERLQSRLQNRLTLEMLEKDDILPNASEVFDVFDDYFFAVKVGDESHDIDFDLKHFYHFRNASKFNIPCETLFNSMDMPRAVDIYVKRIGRRFDFIRIASILKKEYFYERDTPLRITESIVIPAADRPRGQSGSLQIQCSSDIVIAPNITIKGSESMSNAKGSTLILMSKDTVKNEGILCCNGMDDGEGGVIVVVADSFVNNGKVECSPNGQIYIFCKHYINNGVIEPVPDVLLTSDETVGDSDAEWLLGPLVMAIDNECHEIVDSLMESGASAVALKCGQLNVIKLVYQYLVKVKRPKEVDDLMNGAYGDNGCTPLHFACMGGYQDIVPYLVFTVKVDIFRKDNDNKTALDYAEENGHQSIVAWLSQLQHSQSTV